MIKVKVPATTANLGPGFDTLGLALDLHDELEITITDGPTEVVVQGEGAGIVPTDENHLVLRAFRHTLDELGLPQPNINMVCHNHIPQGSGLGSSAAAVVAGIMAAGQLLADPRTLTRQQMLQLATEFEGHPDNAAPAIYGGATTTWMDDGVAHAINIPVSSALRTLVLVPATTLATKAARAVLPAQVPFADATFNIGRVALLIQALNSHPEYLLDATADKLHQEYRAAVMPDSANLVRELRRQGWPAVVSGAGPSVLVLSADDSQEQSAIINIVPRDWRVLPLIVDEKGAQASRELA